MIGFDLDGVICDLYTPFRRSILLSFGVDTEHFCSTFNFIENLPCFESPDEAYEHFHTFIEKEHSCFLPYLGVRETLYYLNYLLKKIPIVTARKNIEELTENWLSSVFPEINFDMHYCSSVDKPRILSELGLRYFVEDRYRTTVSIAKEVPSIETVFLVNRSWNIGRKLPDKVVRVDLLSDIIANLDLSTIKTGGLSS